jgi:hypothetical protein
MTVSLPWFITVCLFALAFAAWVVRDRKWMLNRIDEALDLADQAMDDERLVRVEDWMLLLIAEHHAADIAPATEPLPIVSPDDQPETSPMDLVLGRHWSKDLTGPVEVWPQETDEPDGVESRSFGAHTFRFRTEAVSHEQPG